MEKPLSKEGKRLSGQFKIILSKKQCIKGLECSSIRSTPKETSKIETENPKMTEILIDGFAKAFTN